VYYFRQIFHNNDDQTCQRILQSHIPAMTEHSILLIDDKVLPDEKPPGGQAEYTAALSLAMLVMFKALERRESQWRKLLADAGYEIRAIKRFTDFGDSIIVAAPKK
jgi:O-methyltransferase domain